MARQTFRIDPHTLKDLRIKADRKQMEVGLYLREKFGKPSSQDRVDSATSAYQKIERTGHTSQRTAEALAQYFHVSVEVLQGKSPIDTIKQITELITPMLNDRSNEALNAAFDEAVKNTHYFSIGGPSEPTQEDKIGWLAENIGERIEAVQWARDPAELARLSSLTGLSESELLAPSYVRGHWWVVTRGIVLHEPSSNTARVVRGIEMLQEFIKKAWTGSMIHRRTIQDKAIQLSRDELWHRVALHDHGWVGYEWGVDFVRCEPDGSKGVRWSAASPHNKSFLEYWLKCFAYSNAHTVIDFDGKQVPENACRLCFVVSQRDSESHSEIARMVVRGYALEWWEEKIAGSTQLKEMNYMILSQLEEHLRRSLNALLINHATELWGMRTDNFFLLEGKLVITLFEPEASYYGLRKISKEYRISLMEEMPNGELVVAPWPDAEVTRLSEALKEWVNAPLPDSECDDAARFEQLTEAK